MEGSPLNANYLVQPIVRNSLVGRMLFFSVLFTLDRTVPVLAIEQAVHARLLRVVVQMHVSPDSTVASSGSTSGDEVGERVSFIEGSGEMVGWIDHRGVGDLMCWSWREGGSVEMWR